MDKINHANPVFGRFQDDGARTVAEQNAGGAVGVVEDGSHHIRADHQNFLVRAGGYELRSGLQGEDKSRAGGREIEAPTALCSQLVLHQAGGGREEHVGRDCGHHDGLDFAGVDSALRQSAPGSFGGQIAGSYTFVHDVAFANAGARQDPLVGGLHDFFEVPIGQDSGRDIGSQGGDLGAHQLAHSMDSPGSNVKTLLYAADG